MARVGERFFNRPVYRTVNLFLVGKPDFHLRGVHIYVHQTGRNINIEYAHGEFSYHYGISVRFGNCGAYCLINNISSV